MYIYTPANGNFTISKVNAKNSAEQNGLNNTNTHYTMNGVVSGEVIWQLFGYPMSTTITAAISNNANIGCVYPKVTFMKNTSQFGDTAE